MKNFTQNHPITLQFDKMNYRIWNNKVVLKTLILFLLTCLNSVAQTTSNTPNIKEITSFLSTLKANSVSDYEKLNGLAYNLNPAIYTYDNTLKVYGENYTVLFSDMASLNYIKNNVIPSHSIEMVRINITKTTDLNRKIDLSIFSTFPNLKYIYLYSLIESNENNLNQMFTNYDSKYSLIYSVNLGE